MTVLYYSTQDVAAILDISPATVYREVKAGRLPCERRINRSGGRVYCRFTADEIREYLAAYDPALLDRVPRGLAS